MKGGIALGILGIENRTENWKTARYFAPFFESEIARSLLVQRLLGLPEETSASDLGTIKLELFWQGMRDYIHCREKQDKEKKVKKEDLVNSYNRSFSCLHQQIENAKRDGPNGQKLFADLKEPYNYNINDQYVEILLRNLRNTEIDIVLQSSEHLFIGEAKYKSSFGANGGYVLVHQLIRQYIAAQILLDLTECEKAIIPFLIVDKSVKDKIDTANEHSQIKFMRNQCWLRGENILSWEDIGKIAGAARR